MLFKDFYTLQSVDSTGEAAYTAKITLNARHEIFQGHFPGNPVTPGVCMMQIIKEITKQIINAPLQLQSASNVKFTAIINPVVNPDLTLEFEVNETEEGLIKVKNTTAYGETIALKLSCMFVKR